MSSELIVGAQISAILYRLSGLSGAWVGLVVAGLLVVSFGCAHLLQWRLTRHLRADPETPAPLGRLEAMFSVLAPLALVYFMLERILKRIRGWLLRRRQGKEQAGADAPTDAPNAPSSSADRAKRDARPLVVATLGPTFFFAGILTALVSWTAAAVGQAIAIAVGLSMGSSFWQFFFFGWRPDFAWLLPLGDHPRLALIVGLVFWLVVWWTLGNVLRGLIYRSALRQNLADQQERALPLWAAGFGIVGLTEPSRSYRQWASWLVAVAIFVILVAWATFGLGSGGVSPSALASGLVVTLSWVLNVRLRGFDQGRTADERADGTSAAVEGGGWSAVVDELGRRYGSQPPAPTLERPLPSLRRSVRARDVPSLSPLVADLLRVSDAGVDRAPEPRLTPMQAKVLESLSLLGFVHVEPPVDESALTLAKRTEDRVEDRSGLAERHQVVLAPEGAGKTTLAMLAAANNALVHARATLIVTRSDAQADAICRRFDDVVQPSTARWNLRIRQLGRDFAADLSRDIVPEVVVTSLARLVTGLLDNTEVYSPFLAQVGLVIVDDVESFAGPVEIHAQLAFRRLHLLLRQLTEVERLGEPNAPLMLVLGVDSMKETASWAQALCGIQAVVRSFSFAASSETDPASTTPASDPARQLVYRLSDLSTDGGRPLTVADVVAACEALDVPWHYRACGDDRRHLGRGPLLLPREPEAFCAAARDACVVILEGSWSTVRREWLRLPRAGSHANRREIAVLTVVEPEEELACGDLAPRTHAASTANATANAMAVADSAIGRELDSLPLPIVRPPSSTVVESHLLADLVQRWVEVEDLVTTFEALVVPSLRYLRDQGLLHIEERRDVRSELKEYEAKVYVRALATAVADIEVAVQRDGITELARWDKVRQVELVSARAVAVRNRADSTVLCSVEADSAGLVYYPGRVFESSRGRFVVVGRQCQGDRAGVIEVESVLHDEVSSPRRQYQVVEREPASSPQLAAEVPYPLFAPEWVLLGRDPLEIGLVAVEVTVASLATLLLDRTSGEIRSRQMHGAQVRHDFQPRPLPTIACVIRPNPERAPAGMRRLHLGEARLLTALLRFLLPLLYRDVTDQVAIALAVGDRDGESPAAGEDDLDGDRPLGPRDALYFFDLHRGGNGAGRALFREGFELPLRLCRHVLDQVSDCRRLVNVHDHWGVDTEILDHGEPSVPAGTTAPAGEDAATDTGPWSARRVGLLQWLESHLHPEPAAPTVNNESEAEVEVEVIGLEEETT